jgi:hypothetical protein
LTTYTYQLKRGTAAVWTSSNPVLAAGEIGLETDTRKLKIGDGTTVWNGLAYAVVISAFGRTGVVVATAGDYTATQITNTPAGGIASTTVQAALNELDSEKLAASGVSSFIQTLLDDADAATARGTLGGTTAGQALFTAADAATQSDLLIGARDWRGCNALLNSNFDFWQRGTSLSSGTGGRYCADRWRNDSAGSTYTTSQQAFTLGQTSVPNEPVYFHRTVVTSVANAANYCRLAQRVESVRSFAGKAVVVSFWAKADASKSIAVELVQSFGTGGSPSADVTAVASKVSLTTSWQKFTVTTTLGSISGKTLGSNGDDYLAFNLWFDAGSNFNANTNTLGQQSGTFDIAQAQLEPGAVATSFEQRPISYETMLCSRYFYLSDLVKSAANIVARTVNYSSASQTVYLSFILPQMMRASPSMTAGIDVSDAAEISPDTLLVYNNKFVLVGKNSVTSGAYVDLHWVQADAEL